MDTGKFVSRGSESSYINSFYVNVGKKVHNADLASDYYPVNLIPAAENILEFDPFTIDEIIRLATEIEIDKSSGIPEFNSIIFKDVITTISGVFCKIYKKSLDEGIFPSSWSTGTVIPLPKSGSLQNVSNWRHISILPIQGKILEYLIHKRIMPFLLDNNVVSEHQYGFMPGRSTSEAVFEVTKYLYDNINKGNICGSVYIDI